MHRSIWRLGMATLLGATILVPAASRAEMPRRLLTSPLHRGGRPHAGNMIQSGSGSFPDARPHYHNGEQVICADCHTMHASQQHTYTPGAPRPGEQAPFSTTPAKMLLKAPDPLDLCLSCHDGHTFAPDVVAADANALARRSAGFFDQPETPNPRGHDLGRGLPMGDDLCYRCHFSDGTQKKVTCIDCHDPHGNNVARNLQWASWPDGTPDLGLLVSPSASGMARYEAANVSYGTLNSDVLREPTSMCIDCHHAFSGSWNVDPNGDGIHERHPAYNSESGSPNTIAQGAGDGGSNPAHWNAGTGSGFWTTPRLRFVATNASDYTSAKVVDATKNGILCLTCHSAHGSDQAFGLNWQLQNGYSAPGCDQCHMMANVPAPSPKP